MPSARDLLDRRLMLAFAGPEVPDWLREQLGRRRVGGLTLLPAHGNAGRPAALRALTDALQAASRADLPLLVAADQEGGALVGLGPDSTQFPGAMALGAVGDAELAERIARATAREMRAVGVNVCYAPVADVASNPDSVELGVRAYGDDPAAVAELVAATVRGLQAEGVAATLKHFPGKGEATVDTHHEPALLHLDRARLEAVELAPFRAGVAAGARMVMTGHVAVPCLDPSGALTTLSRPILVDLLRGELGFDGALITDALDMAALDQGGGQGRDAASALAAGADLLLATPDYPQLEVMAAIEAELATGRIPVDELAIAAERIEAVQRWAAGFAEPGLDVVGCAEHQRLADELARRSITLLRDDAGLLPLRPGADERILAILPRPVDLTPADTSSTVTPRLSEALRRRRPATNGVITGHAPTATEISEAVAQARAHDLVVVGTLRASANPAQAELVRALLATDTPTVTVALREPYDLAAYPEAPTHLCAYGILPPTVDALAEALWTGEAPGRLPVAVPGLYDRGHRAEAGARR